MTRLWRSAAILANLCEWLQANPTKKALYCRPDGHYELTVIDGTIRSRKLPDSIGGLQLGDIEIDGMPFFEAAQ